MSIEKSLAPADRQPAGRRRSGLAIALSAAAIAALSTINATSAEAADVQSQLGVNQQLNAGDRLVSSGGGFVFTMQGDGNAVLIAPGNHPVWASNTSGDPGSILRMQDDGNLVIIAPGNHPVWASNTAAGGSVVSMQADGNLVIVAPGNHPVWASNTATAPVVNPVPPGDGGTTPAANLNVSAAGLQFIIRFEGLVLRPSPDPTGQNCTVGYGHKIRPGGCVAGDKSMTSEEAVAQLNTDAASFVALVRRDLDQTPLTQAQFDALVDFTFNIGSGNWNNSSVRRDLRQPPYRYSAVPGHLALWNKATVHGALVALPGLTARRAAEGQLFSSGNYSL